MSSGDESSINAAILSAYNNGVSIVQLSERTYTLRNSIRMRSGITLAGQGIGKTILYVPANVASDQSSDMYVIPANKCPGSAKGMLGVIIPAGTSVNNVTFHGFTMDCSGDAMQSNGYCRGKGNFNCIQLPASNNIKVYSVRFQNGIGDGLRCYGSTNYPIQHVEIYNCEAENLGHDAVYLLRCKYAYVHNNYFIARTNSCTRFQDVIYGYIYDNNFTAYTNVDSNPIMEIVREYWTYIKVEIYRNKIYESWGAGIQVVNITGTKYGRDSANTSVRIHHNLIYNCGNQHGNIDYTAGVVAGNIDNVRIENNVFIGNQGGGVAIMTYGRSASLSGCVITIVNNIFAQNQSRNGFNNSGWGVINYVGSKHYVDVRYNCFYQNYSGTIANASRSVGNFTADPQMASWSRSTGVYNQDCHLKSRYGRYHNGTWVTDGVQSPCIDKGEGDCSNEPEDNGNRIDIGMYGNTSEASLSSGSVKPGIPIADFVYSPTSGTVPLEVDFTDISSNTPTYWKWNFGDDVYSSKRNPTHTYMETGTFNVTLYVSNSAGSNTIIKTGCIRVRAADEPDYEPVAAFTATPTTGINSATVKFTDRSTNGPTSWYWSFGDNTYSTLKNPTHKYTIGKYTVSLKVTNNAGDDTVTKVGYVTVTDGTPVASFIANITKGNLPLTVKFTDKSSNKPNTWKWNFGDKTTSTSKSPTHEYLKSGKFNVTLKVTNSYGTDILTKSNYITVINGNPYTGDMYDNRIKKGSPNTAYSGTSYIDVGSSSNDTFRSLLWFNLDDYKNKTLQSAKLCLYWCGPSSVRENDTVVEVYRPSITWDPDNVTWNHRITDVNWTNKGGNWYDKNGDSQGDVPYDSITFHSTLGATKAYYEFDVTQLINEYVNQQHSNYGFLLKAKTEDSNYIKFYSLECGSNLTVPYLKLKYDDGVIPIATTLYVAGDGSGNFNCDGIDDQIQINQAIKLVKENPTKYSGVYLKGPFTYNISAPIKLAGILEGDATAVIKLVDNAEWASNVALIQEYASNMTGITIRGFTINGNRTNNTNITSGKGYYDLIGFDNCSTIAIYNMKFINGHNNGVYVNKCTNVRFYNNDAQLLGYDGLFVKNCLYVDAYDNTVNCRINNGVHIYNTDYVNIYGNEIYSEGHGAGGIFIEKYGTPQMVNIDIYNNKIHNTMFAAILAIASSSFPANSAVVSIHNNIIYETGAKNTNVQAGGIVTSGFNTDIENNVIDGCYRSGVGIRSTGSIPSITGTVYINVRSNCITNIKKDSTSSNGYGIDYEILDNHDVGQQNNCMYENAGGYHHNVNPPTGDTANIYVDPLYADIANHDYHLKSIAGRWSDIQSKWMSDTVNSPCIDAGFADSECSLEPDPNGGRINIGAYGNTVYESLTGDHPIATNHAPVLSEMTNKVIEIGKTLTFTLSATDEDDDTVMYTMDPIPTGATLGLYTGVFSWLPVTLQEGTYAITFTASDGYMMDSQTINIGVIKEEITSLVSGEIQVNVLREATPTTVYNILPQFGVGGRLVSGSNTKFRTLIMTDFSDYYNKTITSAKLSVFWYYPDGKERGNNTVVEVYRPVSWNTDYACWTNRTEATTWATPGGDWYDKNNTLNGSVPFGSITLLNTTVPDYTYHDIDITDLVKSYCDNTYTNTGILLKASVEDSNWVSFYSQRFLTNAQLKITIEYTE